MSEYVRKEHERAGGETTDCRKDLQRCGTMARQEYGADYFAKLACKDIDALGRDYIVIDSIRNPAEIHHFKNRYPRLTVVGVYAPVDVRWDRMKERYHNDRREFDEDDAVDRDEQVVEGQRVTACFLEADYVVDNSKHITSLEHSILVSICLIR